MCTASALCIGMNGDSFPNAAGSSPALGSGKPDWAQIRGASPPTCQTSAHAAAIIHAATRLIIRTLLLAVTGPAHGNGPGECGAMHVPRSNGESRQENWPVSRDRSYARVTAREIALTRDDMARSR